MRILHILAQLPCATGSGVYFTNLIKGLGQYGHDQGAVFALQDHYGFPPLPEVRQYPLRFKSDALPFPVPGMSDVMPYDSSKYSDMNPDMLEQWQRAFRRLLEQAKADFQPDLLVLHHLWLLSSLAVELFPGVKSIGVCHYTDLRQARLNPELRERHAANIHRLDAVLSLSDIHQAEICEIYRCEPKRIMTMGGGFDSAIFFPPANKRTGRTVKILYAGKIDPSKGVFALIEAFAALRKQDEALELSIVGSPTAEYAEKFDGLIKKHSGLRHCPAMPQEKLAQTMREHDVFVMPSFFEGLGLIAIEALACGLWTVATEIEGLRSLLGGVAQSGIIEFVPLPAANQAGPPRGPEPAAFIEALAMKLSCQAARARQGRGFPEHLYADISRHSWAAIAARVNGVLAGQGVNGL